MMTRRSVVGLLGVAVAATVATGLMREGFSGGREPAAATVSFEQLSLLTVSPDGPETGYQRTARFGPAWSLDADHNGCRQRDDVLRRDMTEVVTSNRCTVVSGVLVDPYTGKTISFSKERANDVQVDHVFPLADAWRHGAAGWTQTDRVAFANSLDNLLATSGPVNAAKGDKGPAEWQPPDPAGRCRYATVYVGVAATWNLSITESDKKALRKDLEEC